MSKLDRLVLGTVQFGLDYGINSEGRPDQSAVQNILALCAQNGVKVLDTAYAYGNCEEVLGQSWPAGAKEQFKVVTKLPPGTTPEIAAAQLQTSLERLKLNSVHGLLFHRVTDYQANKEQFDVLLSQMVKDGLIGKYGFSLYSMEELNWLRAHAPEIGMIQVPYSILDRKFESAFQGLKKDFGTEIHTRSVFLQGLYFKDPDQLPEKLKPMQAYLKTIRNGAASAQVALANYLLGFVFRNELVDGVLIGVDNETQLLSNIEAVSSLKDLDYPEIEVEQEQLHLLSPANW